eukprot:861083-Alexandrium_andersonii.AAC.1
MRGTPGGRNDLDNGELAVVDDPFPAIEVEPLVRDLVLDDVPEEARVDLSGDLLLALVLGE